MIGNDEWANHGELLLTRAALSASLNRVAAGGTAPGQATHATLEQLDAAVSQSRRALRAGQPGDDTFSRIVRRAVLDFADAETLALLAAIEQHREFQPLVRAIEDSEADRLSIDGVCQCLGGIELAATLSPSGRLRRASLIEVAEAGRWANHVVGLPTALSWALLGVVGADADLPPRATLITGDPLATPTPGLLAVAGSDAATRHATATAAFDGAGLVVTSCPDSDKGWRALVRQATIDGRVVVLEVDETVPDTVAWWVSHADHLAWVLSSPSRLALDTIPKVPFRDIAVPAKEASEELWMAMTGEPGSGYRLTPDQLGLVAKVLPSVDSVAAAVGRLSGGHLDSMATCIHPRRSWDDLVMSPDKKAVLGSIVHHRQYRRKVFHDWGFDKVSAEGVVALFVGPPGTGKTLAAEVIAGSLGLDLYSLNISSVVSKFLGETEKNLEAVFRAASAGDAVLFFDEADALFGKRTSVSDAHDRYANVETSYLLQRLERHDGLVLLASNLRQNIDEAFARRMRFIVDFDMPDVSSRRKIWDLSIPPSAPREELDLDRLAETYEISGAMIRNAVLHAAVEAAVAGHGVSMPGLLNGVRREYANSGRLFRG